MRAKDIKPGVVYAYQERAGEPIRPIVFLAPLDRDHLYAKTGTTGPTFRQAPQGSQTRAGTVWNAGTIGYPAALGWDGDSAEVVRTATLARFRQVSSGLGRRCEYVLVVRLARVIGQWEEFYPSSSQDEEG